MRRRDALGLLATLPLAACGRRRRDEGAAIELMVPSDPITLDPRFASDVYGLRASRLVHVGLVEPDATTLAPAPSLAASIEEESPRALIATIRAEARFHDGTRLRARDVVATFRALGDPAVGAPGRRVVETLSSIEALDGDDGLRVRFESRRARAVLRADLETPILKADEAWRPRGAPLTGNGPLRVLDVRPGAVTLTTASGESARRRLVVRTVRDEAARALRLLAGGGEEGGADLAPSCLSPPLALSLPTRAAAPRALGAARCASASLTMLVPNTTRPPFDRPEIRRALAMAIDRTLLVAAKLGGAATLAEGMIPPLLPLAPTGRTPHPFDPAGARAVLASAFEARRLSLVVGNDRGRASVARAIAQMLRDAGVPIEVRTYELATLLGRLGDGDFDLALMTTSEIPDPEVLRWYLHSTAAPPRGANRGRIRDAELDAHLDAALETTDVAARLRAYAALEARVHALAAVLPLWHEDHVVVTSSRAGSYRPSADGRWRAALALL
jgi:peptide/nickel transport system substrate-binding protein